MEDVRAKAASNLKDSFFAGDPVVALLCAKENGLDDWIAPLIKGIVEENRALSRDVLNGIGVDLVMKIGRAQGMAQAAAERATQNAPERTVPEKVPGGLGGWGILMSEKVPGRGWGFPVPEEAPEGIPMPIKKKKKGKNVK